MNNEGSLFQFEQEIFGSTRNCVEALAGDAGGKRDRPAKSTFSYDNCIKSLAFKMVPDATPGRLDLR